MNRITKNLKLKTAALLLCIVLLMMALPSLSFAAWTIEAVDAPKYFTSMSQRSIAIDKVTNQPHIVYGGDHLYHAYYNGTQWQYETVDSSSGVGLYASIAIDSNNKVHISYYDSINSDLKYATNASGSWVTSTIDTGGGAYNTSIAIDSANKVHIGYRGSGLKYATNTTGLWVITTIDSVGDNLSIAVDSNNKVHISYEDTTIRNLKYATNSSGSWVNDIIDSGLGDGAYPGMMTSIIVDTNNKVHISYCSYISANYYLKYITNASGGWVAETIDAGGGSRNSIVLDANNKVHISYYHESGLKYTTNASGTWAINTIDSSANAGWPSTSIAVDSNNVVAISYFIYSQSALGYATNSSGSWIKSTVDYSFQVGSESDIAIDSNNKVHISYRNDSTLKYITNSSGSWVTTSFPYTAIYTSIAVDQANAIHMSHAGGSSGLLYTTNASGSWVTTTVDGTWDVGRYNSIAIDSQDKVHISYQTADSGSPDLMYATNASGSWVISTIDSAGSVGRFTSIAIDSYDKVHISYYDFTNYCLKYATNASGSWVISTVDCSGGCVGLYTGIAVDSYNKAHISYYDGYCFGVDNNMFKYATNASGSWTTSTIDSKGLTGYYSSIAIDSNNKVHISYYDGTNQDLKYATNTSSSWVTSTVDSNGNVGQYNSIAVDSSGKVYISYLDYANNDLKYATNAYSVDLPRTGQTTSYAAGDDGAIQAGAAWPSPRFTDNSDQTITDNLTGLMWTKDAGTPTAGPCTGGTKTWQDALNYVACLNSNNYLGHNDWRLPNRNELESLINKGASNSATWLNGQGFANTQANYYWSSTTLAFNTGYAWVVDMDGGFVYFVLKGNVSYVWPVRAGQDGSFGNSVISVPKTGQTISYATGDDGDIQAGAAWPSPRFTDNGDGTVDDNLTGLMWQQDGSVPTVGSCTGGTKTWQQALDYVACLNSNNYLGHTDWRLPNRNELESLVNKGASSPATWLNDNGFTNTQANYYWSSTTLAFNTGYAWVVDMSYGNGGVYSGYKIDSFYVWPVRGGTVTGGGDTTPPTGTISINSGATYTNSTSVTLTLSCSDANGCAEMKFSNDDITYSTAETYATSKSWTLSSGDGTKTVYVKFKDGAGNWSSAYSDTIVLETVAPTGTISINSGYTYTNSIAVTLNLTCSDSGSGCAEMKFSNDNVTYYPLTAETYAASKAWTLTGGDGTKTVYAKFKDTVGNWSGAYSDTIVLDTTPPTTDASPPGGTYTNSISVTLTCSDGTGSGCKMHMLYSYTYYCLGSGCNPTTAYTGAINISTTTDLRFYSTDNAGKSEAVKTAEYQISTGTGVSGKFLNSEWYLDLNTVYGWGYFGITPAIVNIPGVNSYGGEPNSDLEIVTGSDGYWSHANPSISVSGLWRAIDSKGNVEWYRDTLSDESRGSIAIADVDGDGNLEFIGSTTSGTSVQVMDSFGNFVWTFPDGPKKGIQQAGGFYFPSAPAVADLNPAVSGLEIVVMHRPSGTIIVLDGDNSDGVNDGITFTGIGGFTWTGTEGVDWDVLWTYTTGGYDSHGSAAIGDVDNDGALEVVVGSQGGNVYVLNGITGAAKAVFTTSAVQASPALANLDADPYLEIVIGDTDGTLYVLGWDGVNAIVKSSIYLGSPIYSSASIGDIDGDGELEIVVAALGGKVYAFTPALSQKWVYPSTGSVGAFYSSPSLADRANVNPYDIDWQMFRHDAKRTGFYGASANPLDVYIGSMDSYLYLIEGKTGALIDRFQSSGPIHGSPTIGDIDGDGKLNIIFESWGQYGGSTDMDRLWNIEEASLYITINSGASFTNSTSVTLSLSCSGDCVQMQFSNDNTNWSSTEAYSTSKSWTLSSGDGTKTVYVKFKDSGGIWSSAYSDTIVLDATSPTGTISINSGNTYTNSTSVTLSLTCSDTNSCKEMQFSNDNVTYSTAETYATSKSWTLSSGDGAKTVYVKFKDNADNWSSAYSDTIELDTTLSITGSITINSGATYTKSTSVTLNLACSASTGCAEMQFSNDNANWSALEAYSTSKAWTLTSGDGTKTVYAKFKDNVGIWSSTLSDTIILDTTSPSKPKNIEVNQGSNKDELVITWTQPSDSDFNHIHIYRSTTSGVLGSLIADNLTGIQYTDTGLASQTTYYYTVRAVDNAGNESTNTNTQSNEYGLYPYATTLDATPPGVPSNITATDAGTGGKINLSWTNPADSDFSHIHIYRSTASGSLGSLVYDNVTGTSKSDTGLTNGLTYYYVIRSVDTSANETTNTAQVSAIPTAPDITAPGAVSSVVISDPATGGVLNISWTNPADSDFAKVRIYRSTISGQLGSLVYEVTGNSVSDTGLTSGTTYYYTFHTVDALGNESTHTTQYSGMPTDIVAPNPVTELTATLLSGGKVKLDWIRSSSEDINYYNIYYDNGTGTIDYTTAIASVQHPTVTWTSGALTVGTRYLFAIRAEDTSLNKETNTNVISVVPVTDPNAGDVSASIKVPQTGKKVCGNMVTVMAELLMGTVADTQKIRLQYKTVASGTWSDIPSTDPAKFPNPDTTSPYFVHWDVTTLADGDYNLRAVATSNALVTDSNPPYITITVDSVNCSSQETTNAGGEKTKAEDVSKNASSNSVMAGSTGVTTVALPEGSLDADTKINITESDPATKATLVPSGYSNGSSFNEIGFESGQTTLANNKKATVEIPYKDNDNNGIVDGTSVKVYDLQICNYKSGTGWTCLDSLVDTDKKTVKAKTEKFSLFGLLMPPKPVGAEWNLLSVPLQPSPNTPSAVFGSVTNYTNYVLWWNPAIGDYQIVSTIETGKSYWVWGNGKNLGTVSGTETPNSNFSISIKKGWNMIGHPFRYKVNVSDFWIYYGGNYYTIADAETNGWVVATVYKYENGAYQFQSAQDGGVLEAWKGYWILSDIDCTLIVPPTPAQ